jgi:ribonuclease HII
MHYIAGVDEAGRGPLAGPVVAAAVILNPEQPILDLNDSKLLSRKKRTVLFGEIKTKAMAFGIGICSVTEIEQLNILQATLLAMHKAVDNLAIKPDHVLVDGNMLPKWSFNAKAIIKGDQTEPAISAASIIAKVTRDNLMVDLDQQYPQYGFAKHKGYGTKAHVNAILQHGKTTQHRDSFLKKILARNTYT